MLQLLLYGLLAIILAGGLFAAAARFLPAGEQIAPPLRDEPPWDLPMERSLSPDDVDGVRLPVALRGYRFAETDLLLDRLAAELRARDEEIARLRGRAPRLEPFRPESGEPARPEPSEPAASELGAPARPEPAEPAEPAGPDLSEPSESTPAARRRDERLAGGPAGREADDVPAD